MTLPPPSESAFKRRLSDGFTLLELSIVLVIIGLLIGGVFVGQSLIHNAQINAVITEFNRYQTATQAFKQQYQALPGDINNATSFWGSAGGSGGDAACNTAAATATGTSTCNGNGDGIIWQNGNGVYEQYTFWKHLANAKMIEGSYNGSSSGGTYKNVNTPSSKFPSGGWAVFPSTSWVGGNWFSADYSSTHTLILGGDAPYSWNYGSIMRPKDAWSIDKKIDDGKPGTGNVIGGPTNTCTNAAAVTDLAATYTLSDPNNDCLLVFLANF